MSEESNIKQRPEQIYPEPTVGPIIYNEKGEILLIRSPKWGEAWHIPGGHIEVGETAEQALKREVGEETGLEIDRIEFIGWQDAINPEFFYQKRHFVFLDFCARLAGGEIKKSEEMTEFVWVQPAEALKTLKIDSYTVRTVQFYLARKEKSGGEDYLNKWKRALADYDNLKKETAKEREEIGRFASAMAAARFLEIYENFKKALDHEINGSNLGAWKEGMGHIRKQFADTLKQMGIEEIKTAGEKFDPKLHEAVGEEGADGVEPGAIVREVEGGYKMGEKVIKAAKVVVGK